MADFGSHGQLCGRFDIMDTRNWTTNIKRKQQTADDKLRTLDHSALNCKFCSINLQQWAGNLSTHPAPVWWPAILGLGEHNANKSIAQSNSCHQRQNTYCYKRVPTIHVREWMCYMFVQQQTHTSAQKHSYEQVTISAVITTPSCTGVYHNVNSNYSM